MKRVVLAVAIIFSVGFSACASNGKPLSTYLSFASYKALAEKCDTQEIVDTIAATDNPDLMRNPVKAVRFCRPGLIVLESHGMRATEEFKLIDIEKQKFYTLELRSAGYVCANNIRCDLVTEEVCDANKDCKHIRLIALLNKSGREITKAVIRTSDSLTMTDGDFVETVHSQTAINPYLRNHIYFHQGAKRYTADGTYPNEDAKVIPLK
jgi:hypothetical protein